MFFDKLNNFFATHIVSLSGENKKFIIEKEKADPDKVKMIHHGIPKEDYLKVNQKKVIEFKDESSAFNNGIKRGDIIIKIGRENINSIEDYNNQINKYSIGDVIMLRLERNENQVIRAFTIK